MDTSKDTLAVYLTLIKKITNKTVIDMKHQDFKEDIAHEVFIKLYRQGFFSSNNLDDEDNVGRICNYIKNTVRSCYLDHLQTIGINRRLSAAERLETGAKYQNVVSVELEDTNESDNEMQTSDSSEHYQYFEEAYSWIKSCFDGLVSEIKDLNRRKFTEEAFWRFDEYGLTMKALASQLGYTSSNPTQEFKRFTQKVALCTEPHGISISLPQEQIQFLREKIIALGGE